MVRIVEKVKSFKMGGIEVFAAEISSALNSGKNRTVIYADDPEGSERLINTAKKSGVKIITPPKNRNALKIKPMRIIAKWNDFRRFCKKSGADVVHVHMYRPYDVFFGYAAKAAGVKKVILHSHCAGRSDVSAAEASALSLFRYMSRVSGAVLLACSEEAGIYMFGKNSRFRIIKNGINTGKFAYSAKTRAEVRARLGLENKLVAGNVGRLAEIKNHMFLLDVFAELLKLRDDAVLLIAGGGELEDDLIRRADELGISDKVIFSGTVEDPSGMYQAMDCFVFPSKREGLGIAAIEAQCSGLPVICSDAVPREAGVTELCTFLPLSEGAARWAEAIISRTDGYERRDRKDDIRAAGYDMTDTAAELEKIYSR